MSIKEKLTQLKEELLFEENNSLKEMANQEDPLHFGSLYNSINALIEQKHELESENARLREVKEIKNNAILDIKIENFTKSHTKTFQESNELKNMIEKMAVWYEIKFPSYDITEEIKKTPWQKLYKNKKFYNSLTDKEKEYLIEPVYPTVLWEHYGKYIHIHLSEDGKLEEVEKYYQTDKNGKYINNPNISDDKIEEIIENLYDKIDNLEEKNQKYKNQEKFIKGLMECVMYKVIDRGGSIIGPRRGLIFAQKFGTNIDVPMKYGFDTNDAELKEFINCYFSLGGNRNVVCYVNYFARTNNDELLEKNYLSSLINPPAKAKTKTLN